jgi:hypothetical protein
VDGLQGRAVASAAPTDGYALIWNNGLSRWEPGTVASSGNTLDQAYDEGGAGAGRTIAVDSGPILLNVSGDDTGLSLAATGNLDQNPILKTDIASDTNSQLGVYFRLTSDGYSQPQNVTSDMIARLPSGGYTATGITSLILPAVPVPADSQTIWFDARAIDPGADVDGLLIAYDVNSNAFAQFDYALRADSGHVSLEDGSVFLLDGYILLGEQSADPPVTANTGFVYTKDDAGDTELFYFDAAGNAVQITKDGVVNGGGGGAGNLQQAYDGGRIIVASSGPMEIDAYGEEAINIDGYLGIAYGVEPDPLDNKGLIYVREIGSTHQLFYMDNGGTSYQLTTQGQGLQATVDTSLLGIPSIPVGPFPFPPTSQVLIDVAQGEDIFVTFSAYADPGGTVNPFENIYARLEVDAVPVFVNKVTVVPAFTGSEAYDISFSYLLTNLPSGQRNITVTLDTGTAPGDPAGFAAINTPVLGAARVLSSANVTLQMAYQNGRHIFTQQGVPVHIDAYDAYEGLNIDGYLGLNPLIAEPDPIGEKGIVYTYDVDGYSELHYLDDYGKSSQITSKGSLNADPVTLDQAYDGETGSGSGRIITVDSGPVQLNVSGDDSGLSLIAMGNLDGNALFESYVENDTNGQIGNWFQFISDGYYEPRNIISDMTTALPAGGSYTAVGISSDLRPFPSNPADTTTIAFKADVHGIDSPREGVYIAYEVVNSGYPLVQFQYALHADLGSIGLDSGDLLLLDGYVSLGEVYDPTPNDDTGFVYVKDADGYSELFYMDNYGTITQVTDDGYLAGSSNAAQDNLDSTGTETSLSLTYVPLVSLDTDSGKDLQVYRNGILIRWIAALGADPNRWTYNSSLNRVEFVASGTSDWYTAIYNRR